VLAIRVPWAWLGERRTGCLRRGPWRPWQWRPPSPRQTGQNRSAARGDTVAGDQGRCCYGLGGVPDKRTAWGCWAVFGKRGAKRGGAQRVGAPPPSVGRTSLKAARLVRSAGGGGEPRGWASFPSPEPMIFAGPQPPSPKAPGRGGFPLIGLTAYSGCHLRTGAISNAPVACGRVSRGSRADRLAPPKVRPCHEQLLAKLTSPTGFSYPSRSERASADRPAPTFSAAILTARSFSANVTHDTVGGPGRTLVRRDHRDPRGGVLDV
jgi:hypothetical protein